MMHERVEKLFQKHKQMAEWSCSASAYEFIAKLHGKVSPSEYPLQSDAKASHKAGFGFESFLNKIGFTSHDEHLPPKDALHRLEKEVLANRFPLVALVKQDRSGRQTAHIVVAVRGKLGVALADPQAKVLITRDGAETLALLKRTSVAVSRRPNIHCLFYTERDNAESEL